MRKFFLSAFTVLLLALCRPSVVSAASGLVIDPSSIATTQYGAQALFDLSFLDEGLFSSSGWEGFSHGGVVIEDIFTFDSSDFTITELNNDQKITLLEAANLYYKMTDQSGFAPIQTNQPLYLANFDNGFISGVAYLDQNGNVILSSPSLDDSLITYTFGGSEYSLEDFVNLVGDISDDVISSPALSILQNFDPVTDSSYFFWVGQDSGSRPAVAYSIYVANQYNPGTIVPVTNSGFINSWYCNNPNLVVYNQTYGAESNRLSITAGNFTKNGHSYHYQVTYNGYVGSYIVNGEPVINSYDDWINGRSPSNAYWFAQTGIAYDPSKDNGGAKAFQPYLVVNGNKILLDDPYSYSSIHDSYVYQKTRPVDRNSDFDNTKPVSDTNYPIYYPTDVTLTDSFPYPIELDPSVEFPLEGTIEESTIMGSFMESNVPFFTNLKYRFPFSIPWDVYDSFKYLDQQAIAPAWDFDWKITILNHTYTYNFKGDLSDFDDLARIFRLLEKAAFLIFLMFFSYKQFF